MAQKLLNSVNDRTYQEVEYLKKSLGPVLVAALAEICIRRPADPIEYLGHWLLRWRYNEELKRRDVQNAMDIVKQRQWAQMKDDAVTTLSQAEQPESVAKDVPDDLYSRGQLEEEMDEMEQPDTETIFPPPKASPRSSTNARKSSAAQSARLSGTGTAGGRSSTGQAKKVSGAASLLGEPRASNVPATATQSPRMSGASAAGTPAAELPPAEEIPEAPAEEEVEMAEAPAEEAPPAEA